MTQHFSSQCRRVVGRAQDQARQLGHPFLGTEHVLLAMLDDADGYTVTALRSAGVDIGEVRRAVWWMIGDRLDPDALMSVGIDLQRVRDAAEAQFGAGALGSTRWPTPIKGHLPMTRRVRAVLELAALAARKLGQSTITPEHLMLGMLDDAGGIAVRALRDCHVEVAELRLDIATYLQRGAA